MWEDKRNQDTEGRRDPAALVENGVETHNGKKAGKQVHEVQVTVSGDKNGNGTRDCVHSSSSNG